MKMKKAPLELVETIVRAMEGIDCERRIMFGFPCFFINKNMFAGLFEDKLFLRLSEQQLRELRAQAPLISNLEPMPGRPMKDYWVIPDSLVADKVFLQRAVDSSARHTRTLAPKSKKPRSKAPGSPVGAAKRPKKRSSI
jgi:TfoX/Sxy family transcriptional regulator of competence genes